MSKAIPILSKRILVVLLLLSSWLAMPNLQAQSILQEVKEEGKSEKKSEEIDSSSKSTLPYGYKGRFQSPKKTAIENKTNSKMLSDLAKKKASIMAQRLKNASISDYQQWLTNFENGKGFDTKAKSKNVLATKNGGYKTATGGKITLDIEPGIPYNLKKLLKQEGVEFSKKSDAIQQRREFRNQQLRNPKTGKIPEGIEKRSLEFAKNLEKSKKGGYLTEIDTPVSAWKQRGPYNVGGRTRALAFDVRDENILLAGGVSGGMWRSVNQGASWTRVTDWADHPSVTDIEQDPTNPDVWYYSTGEFYGNSASAPGAFFLGEGIFKSADNGVTWNVLPSTTGSEVAFVDNRLELVTELAINPINGDVYAATVAGLMRSQDEGTTWEVVLPGAFLTVGHVEITSTGVMYAAIGSTDNADAGETGIWRSETGDDGDWVNVSAGAPLPTNYGRIVFGISPSNEDELYVYADGFIPTIFGNFPDLGLLKYTHSTGTWEDRTANLPNFGGSVGDVNTQGGYNMYIQVHPTNSDMVFLGATNIYRSTDGFSTPPEDENSTWIGGYSPINDISIYPGQHPDNHRIVFFNSNPDRAITGSDGGVSITEDITANNFSPVERVEWEYLNNGYYTTQPYAISIGPGEQLLAGFQDNSTYFTNNDNTTDNWAVVFGGDGAYNAFSEDGSLRYVSSQGGNMFRAAFDDADDKSVNSYTAIRPEAGSQFITPFELDPNDKDIMYFAGGSGLWRNLDMPTATTTDGWELIASASGITVIGISEFPANVVYYGTGAGTVTRLDNATGNVISTDVSSGLPAGNIGGIKVDPFNANHVVVVLTNYEIRSIFESFDGGSNWSDVSGSLEDAPDGSGNGPSIQWVEMLGNNQFYFVGTSVGVYATDKLSEDTQWEFISEIGNVPTPQLRTRNSDGLIVAATHGNGIFSAKYDVDSNPFSKDVGVSNLNVPESINPDASYNAEIVVTNYGANAETGIPVSLMLNGAIVATENIVATIGSQQTASYTFTTEIDLSAEGDYDLKAFTSLIGDTQFANDTTTASTSVLQVISSFPYSESFETGAGGWKTFANSSINSWEVGTPSTPDIIGASDGTQAWVTNADGNYSTNERSWVTSPVFDFSSLSKPSLNFDYNYDLDLFSGIVWDGVSFQYSTDFGQSWVNLGAIGEETNWFDANISGSLDYTGGNGDGWGVAPKTSGYRRAGYPLEELAGEPSVIFRFAFGSDEVDTYEGFAFDNFVISEPTNDLAVTAITAPTSAGALEQMKLSP